MYFVFSPAVLLFCCWMDSSNAIMGGGISVWALLLSDTATVFRSRIWSKLEPSTTPLNFLTGPPSPASIFIRGLKYQ